MIEARKYIFKPQTVLPMGGSTRQLTSEYELRVSKDTISVFLPYFGRAYAAPVNPAAGGFQFKSTDFEYNTKQGRKGWDILISPKDANDIRQLILSVSKNGYASLQVTSNNRQPISFNGYFTEGK